MLMLEQKQNKDIVSVLHELVAFLQIVVQRLDPATSSSHWVLGLAGRLMAVMQEAIEGPCHENQNHLLSTDLLDVLNRLLRKVTS